MKEFFVRGDVHYCTCECHIFESELRHSFPCCALVYQKYIDKNKNIDEELLDVAILEHVEYIKKYLESKKR